MDEQKTLENLKTIKNKKKYNTPYNAKFNKKHKIHIYIYK